jgi:hypothetical protein
MQRIFKYIGVVSCSIALTFLIAPLVLAQDNSTVCISGVVVSETDPLVVINGQIARLGDNIGGAEIKKITHEGVEFEYKGRITFVKINQGCKEGGVDFLKEFGADALSGIEALSLPQLSKAKTQLPPFDYDKRLGLSEGQKKAIFGVLAGMMGIAFLISLAVYVYCALTLQLIATKTDTSNSWLAWIPIANLYLMCKVSGKPGWWLLLLLVPLINIVFMIVIWVGIAEARKKPTWLGILMIIPGINFIVMGYLAFSSRENPSEISGFRNSKPTETKRTHLEHPRPESPGSGHEAVGLSEVKTSAASSGDIKSRTSPIQGVEPQVREPQRESQNDTPTKIEPKNLESQDDKPQDTQS